MSAAAGGALGHGLCSTAGGRAPSTARSLLEATSSGFPGRVVDYVLLHRVAHLVERDHNARFWGLVNAHPESSRARGFLEGGHFAARAARCSRAGSPFVRVVWTRYRGAQFLVEQGPQLRVQVVGFGGGVAPCSANPRVTARSATVGGGPGAPGGVAL